MKATAKELEFISQIKRDGSGVKKVPESYLRSMLENPLMNNENFKIHCLSLNQKTFIAHGFNSFIVKLKK
jgi:hypothetical protein